MNTMHLKLDCFSSRMMLRCAMHLPKVATVDGGMRFGSSNVLNFILKFYDVA